MRAPPSIERIGPSYAQGVRVWLEFAGFHENEIATLSSLPEIRNKILSLIAVATERQKDKIMNTGSSKSRISLTEVHYVMKMNV